MYVATAVVLCGTISCSSKKESKSTQSYTTSTEVLQGSWNIISVDGKKIDIPRIRSQRKKNTWE